MTQNLSVIYLKAGNLYINVEQIVSFFPLGYWLLGLNLQLTLKNNFLERMIVSCAVVHYLKWETQLPVVNEPRAGHEHVMQLKGILFSSDQVFSV